MSILDRMGHVDPGRFLLLYPNLILSLNSPGVLETDPTNYPQKWICSGQVVLTLYTEETDYISVVVFFSYFYFFIRLYEAHFFVPFRGLWLGLLYLYMLNGPFLKFNCHYFCESLQSFCYVLV